MGFEVVGVDFIQELVARAEENAARHGVSIQGLVQEISQLEVPPASFDLGLISAAMYSCIPTRKRRVEMLTRIKAALKPEGYFLCQFILDPDKKPEQPGRTGQKGLRPAYLGKPLARTGGRPERYGVHAHISVRGVNSRSEFAAAGFAVLHFQSEEFGTWRGAVLQRLA